MELKQPQTLDEDEEPPSPLSTANHSINLNLEDMKNGSLQLLKESDNGDTTNQTGDVSPPPDDMDDGSGTVFPYDQDSADKASV